MNVSRLDGRFFSTSAQRLAKNKKIREVKLDFKKKVNTIVFGSGLSASGALSVPKLVVNNRFVTSKEVNSPVRISQLNTFDIKYVSAGFGFSLFASSKQLYGSGINNRYQLTTNLSSSSSPTDYYISSKLLRLPGDPVILSISSGRAHSLVATSAGVFAFGENCHGQCGQNPEIRKEVFGNSEEKLPLVRIPSDSPVKRVHCSLDTSFVLTEAGEIFSFGLNEDGQCANGSDGIQWQPSRIIGDADGEKITSIAGASDTIMAVSNKGDLFLWGQSEYGQSLIPNSDIFTRKSMNLQISGKKIASAAASSAGCLVSTVDGETFVWGVGILGMGPDLQRQSRPLLMDKPLFDNEKVVQVTAGISSFAAVNAKGGLFTWGQNRFGLLGLGHNKDQFFPFLVTMPCEIKEASLGPDHSIFLAK